jgi:hypothetical protein
MSVTVLMPTTLSRSDSGRGGSLPLSRAAFATWDAPLIARIGTLARTGADLIAQHVSGSDFDAFCVLGRYAIARAAARCSRMAPNNILFVFSPTPPDRSVSTHRRQKTNLAPSLRPQEGRGRSLSACSEQAEFPATEATGVCR